MKFTGKTQSDIDKEKLESDNKLLADQAQEEVNKELDAILRGIAIEKYIEKQATDAET